LLTRGVALFALVGCESTSVVDSLTVFIPNPAEVDTTCSDGGCDSLDTLAVNLTWVQDEYAALPEDSEVHVYQYRVDYSVPGLEVEEIPFYAGYSDFAIKQGESIDVSVVAMGNTQRSWLASAILPGEILSGSGLLTFAGWGPDGEVIEFPPGGQIFTLGVGNFSALSGEPTTNTTTGI